MLKFAVCCIIQRERETKSYRQIESGREGERDRQKKRHRARDIQTKKVWGLVH